MKKTRLLILTQLGGEGSPGAAVAARAAMSGCDCDIRQQVSSSAGGLISLCSAAQFRCRGNGAAPVQSHP